MIDFSKNDDDVFARENAQEKPMEDENSEEEKSGG